MLSPEQNGRHDFHNFSIYICMRVCVGVCVWPIDEIKQFLGLLENYYKRIIKRGAKVESKQRRCQNNKCQCPPPSPFLPWLSAHASACQANDL